MPSDKSLGWGSNIQNARLARAAEQALQHGDKALALDYAQRAAQATPNDLRLWFLLGYAARLDGKQSLSVNAYSRGLQLNPSSVEGLSGLAQTFSMMGRNEDAVRLLKQVVTADPRRRDDVLLLGDLNMRLGDYTGALDWLGRAERMQPDARSELLMALSYQHLKQMNKANHYLEMAKRRDPNNPEVQRTMAGYYREVGNYPEAISALKLIQNPSRDVIAELAYTYQLTGDFDDSARLYAQVANADIRNLDWQFAAAQAELAAGSIDKANLFLTHAAALDANNYRLHAIRGDIAKLQDRERDAVLEYSAALASLPASPTEGSLYGIQLHMDLMELYRDMNYTADSNRQLQIARSEIKVLDENRPRTGQYLHLRALIKMNGGDLQGALADIVKEREIDAHDRNGLQLNGDILIRLGRTDEAISIYKQILADDPANRFALTSLGYALRAAGHNLEAEKCFLSLAKANPSLYIPYLALGDIYTAEGEFANAQVSYGKAYALDPQKPQILAGGMNAAIEDHNLDLAALWLSRVTNKMHDNPQILQEQERYLSFKGLYQESASIGWKAIKVLPGNRDVVIYLGYDLLHLGEYTKLLILTSKYLTIFPNEPDIPLLEGYVHKHQGKLKQAQLDFTEALKRDPGIVTGYVNLGYISNDMHQPKAAAEDFSAALEREPDNGEAHLGLAYASLDLHKPKAALQQAQLAEHALGDLLDIHLIRATAYGQEDMLSKASGEYQAALKFTPNDGSLHFDLGNTLYAERRYHDAISELTIAKHDSPDNAAIYALIARSYANLQNREKTLKYVQLAEMHGRRTFDAVAHSQSGEWSNILISTGEALSTLGDKRAAIDRFRQALEIPGSNWITIRMAIAQVMAQQDHSEDAERQIALAMMEAEAGETVPPSASQYIMAADVFRTLHDYELSQSYLQRAKAAGAPDAEVRIGLANNYLALGDAIRAEAELAAIRLSSDNSDNYQYLLAQANVLRQQHNGADALTSFAQASNSEGEDQIAQEAMLQSGADEGLRLNPTLSILSDLSVEPIYEDTTVYVLDSKLDASFAVPINDTALLPPPRSSIETQSTSAFHLHIAHIPTPGGFYQIRNTIGQISVPSTNTIVNRNTTDNIFNIGLNPTVNLGNNIITFNGGIQTTIRRDSESPVAMNQNLFRMFAYMSTSAFLNAVSVTGYVIREAGPFTESNLHSLALTGALDFRVGAPWGKTAMVAGWGANDQKFSPVSYEDYYTSSYIGLEHRFSERLNIRALIEDLRAWRIVGAASGNAQNVRPAGMVDFNPTRNWGIHYATAYSSTRSFHVYDATQNGVSISYSHAFHHMYNGDSKKLILQYPVRFSAGFQEEDFFNFKGGHTQQLRPYVQLTLF